MFDSFKAVGVGLFSLPPVKAAEHAARQGRDPSKSTSNKMNFVSATALSSIFTTDSASRGGFAPALVAPPLPTVAASKPKASAAAPSNSILPRFLALSAPVHFSVVGAIMSARRDPPGMF